MKTEVIDFRSFVRGEWREENVWYKELKFVSIGSGMFMVLAPQVAQAQSKEQTMDNIWVTVLEGVDWLCVGVFVFCGVSWMFGNRTKAIELGIGGAAGYLIARHAIEIKDFLKSI
jgi:hypothetical protein